MACIHIPGHSPGSLALLDSEGTLVTGILKGQLQGHTTIFKGLKMTFRTKILRKKTIPR